ncbi:MAG TPA: DUF2127 domain-containing protein [Bryobacteraceae bacterium]|jgi:uncharacterized membrane protein (DUF2068 family)|nr:DUF2127 domain-containing protein [Bryobacteraceae bacterium]
MRASKHDPWLFLIGVFKLVKGISLVILGVGLLKLLHRDVAAVTQHWIEVLRVDPDNRFIHRALVRVFNVTPKQLKELSAGTFVYAGIFLTEGTGLLARKHWAEYMTLISTGLFIPLEVYEIYRHFTWVKLAVTVVNALIVWYLAVRVRGKKRLG